MDAPITGSDSLCERRTIFFEAVTWLSPKKLTKSFAYPMRLMKGKILVLYKLEWLLLSFLTNKSGYPSQNGYIIHWELSVYHQTAISTNKNFCYTSVYIQPLLTANEYVFVILYFLNRRCVLSISLQEVILSDKNCWIANWEMHELHAVVTSESFSSKVRFRNKIDYPLHSALKISFWSLVRRISFHNSSEVCCGFRVSIFFSWFAAQRNRFSQQCPMNENVRLMRLELRANEIIFQNDAFCIFCHRFHVEGQRTCDTPN